VTTEVFNVCLLGFGRVNRALLECSSRSASGFRAITGSRGASRGSRRGAWGSSPTRAASTHAPRSPESSSDRPFGFAQGKRRATCAWLRDARADVVLEATPLEPHTGEPAIAFLRAALEHGAHVITANKGPVAHAHTELSSLAASRGRHFLFEASVMGGTPIFALLRDALPAVDVLSVRAVLNATTTVILEALASGTSFASGVRAARARGFAETDVSNDVDGWDAAVKIAALANVAMGARIAPADVAREGIRGFDARAKRGKTWRLVARADRDARGRISASVRPELLDARDRLAVGAGTVAIEIVTDVHPGVFIACEQADPSASLRAGLRAIACDMLADLVTAVGRKGHTHAMPHFEKHGLPCTPLRARFDAGARKLRLDRTPGEGASFAIDDEPGDARGAHMREALDAHDPNWRAKLADAGTYSLPALLVDLLSEGPDRAERTRRRARSRSRSL
jgi:homoserine dehydrogenase